MFELEGLPPATAMEAMRLAAFKLAIKTNRHTRGKLMKGRRKENLATLSVPELEALERIAGSVFPSASFDIRRTR